MRSRPDHDNKVRAVRGFATHIARRSEESDMVGINESFFSIPLGWPFSVI